MINQDKSPTGREAQRAEMKNDNGINVSHSVTELTIGFDHSDSPRNLEETLKHDGFIFKILRRSGNWTILRKRQDHWPEESWTHDVVKIRLYPAGERFGKMYSASEGLPPCESWGTYGFLYGTLDKAKEQFTQMALEDYGGRTEDVANRALGTLPALEKKATPTTVERGVA